jgi:hypothetical protein
MSLSEIQKELKAPKGQWNSFGKYNYRSLEDILKALKPLLDKHGYHQIISYEMLAVGTRHYVKAVATLYNGLEVVGTNWACAREPEKGKNGMDDPQTTGATSSYAGKYCLNGLYNIDDTKDADATNDHSTPEQTKTPTKPDVFTAQEAVNRSMELLKDTDKARQWIKAQMKVLYSCDKYGSMNSLNLEKMTKRMKEMTPELAREDFIKLTQGEK